MTVLPLDWDSEFFNLTIGRVTDDPAQSAKEADEKGFDCLYMRVDAKDDRTSWAAQRAGFRFVDVRVEMERPLSRLEVERDPKVELADVDDKRRLEHFCRNRFELTRFFADPNFPRERAEGLYLAWLERGLTSESRFVLTTTDHDGFVICGEDSRSLTGAIELIAVDEKSEGKGIGSRLLKQAHYEFVQRKLTSAQVVTQGRNLAAQGLYVANGYRFRDVSLWFHRWRTDVTA